MSSVSTANRAALRMEGEDGNDNFVIRSFVLETNVSQEDVVVGGGNGDDKVEYNINAPLSINGGAGFDTVVALGTELDDAFVIKDNGVFGAGLNIQIDGVEEALEVDALEGDDTFFVLSTRAGVVTTLIGGLGSDTFNVTGDVTKRIVSNNLEGVGGIIGHGVNAPVGSAFQNLLVDGVQVSVAGRSKAHTVVLSESGGSTNVIEGSSLFDSYSVVLSNAIVDASTIVFVTVSVALASTADRRREKTLRRGR